MILYNFDVQTQRSVGTYKLSQQAFNFLNLVEFGTIPDPNELLVFNTRPVTDLATVIRTILHDKDEISLI